MHTSLHTNSRFQKLTLLFITLFALALLPSSANAAASPVVAKVTLESVGEKVQVVAVLTSRKKLVPAKRPRKVTLMAGITKISLTRKGSKQKASKNLGTWKSAAYDGETKAALVALAGKKITLAIKTKAGTTRITSPLTDKTTSTGGDGGNTGGDTGGGNTGGGTGGDTGGGTVTPPASPFTPPATDLTGTDAYNHFATYLNNSRFTDCVAYWPNCGAVSYSYVHCPDYKWQYHRDTSVSGADIHSYDYYTVTGANMYTTGAWAISYTTGTGGNYSWAISATGQVTGTYEFNGSSEALGPFTWAQPGGSWDHTEGNC